MDEYPLVASPNVSIGISEINNRFGFHKGDEKTQPIHRGLRLRFISLAMQLDEILPPGRAKQVAFTELETAAMWAHKAVAEMAPVVTDI